MKNCDGFEGTRVHAGHTLGGGTGVFCRTDDGNSGKKRGT